MTQQTDIALGVGARSEKGRREDNQDKMTSFSTPLGTFYIVADGMGGHRGGAEASLSVVEGYRKHLQAFPEAADFADVLQHATVLTNAEILAAGRSGDPSIAGMGSTVVMAMLRTVSGGVAGGGASGMEVLTAHIGDSRAYLLRGGKLTQLTHDHSAVQRMVDEQLISPEAARTHPDLNVLTRAIGKQAEIAIEVGPRLALYPGDTILLCTDGLWGHVPDERMAYELSVDRSASETADVLVQLALDQGSDDNITLQILRLEDRNGGGRSMTVPPLAAAPMAPIPVTGLQELHRGRPVLNAPPAAFAGAPPVRVQMSGLYRKRSNFVAYLLLLILCGGLLYGGYFFTKKYRKATQPPIPVPAAVEKRAPAKPAAGSSAPAPVPPLSPEDAMKKKKKEQDKNQISREGQQVPQ